MSSEGLDLAILSSLCGGLAEAVLGLYVGSFDALVVVIMMAVAWVVLSVLLISLGARAATVRRRRDEHLSRSKPRK